MLLPLYYNILISAEKDKKKSGQIIFTPLFSLKKSLFSP